MQDDLSALSVPAQDYLKSIWTIQEVSGKPATVSALAARMQVVASTASEAVRRLEAGGFVEHARYGSISLTAQGERLALAMVRRHRLLETFLVKQLGYAWDEVQGEADVLEHAVSDRFVERLESMLGYPTVDPHGDPIPGETGLIEDSPALPLADAQPGGTVRITRIVDAKPELLRFLAENGLVIGARLRVSSRSDTAEVITLTVNGRDDPVPMGLVAAQSVLVLPAGRRQSRDQTS